MHHSRSLFNNVSNWKAVQNSLQCRLIPFLHHSLTPHETQEPNGDFSTSTALQLIGESLTWSSFWCNCFRNPGYKKRWWWWCSALAGVVYTLEGNFCHHKQLSLKLTRWVRAQDSQKLVLSLRSPCVSLHLVKHNWHNLPWDRSIPVEEGRNTVGGVRRGVVMVVVGPNTALMSHHFMYGVHVASPNITWSHIFYYFYNQVN